MVSVSDLQPLQQTRYLLESTCSLTSVLEREAVLREATLRAGKLFDSDLMYVLLWDPHEEALVHSHGVIGTSQLYCDCEGCRFAKNQGITGTAASLGMTLRVNDVTSDSRYRLCPHTHMDIRSEMAIPVFHGQQLLGVLDFESTRPNAFAEEAEGLGGDFSRSFGIALANSLSFERMHEMAHRDGLTGLYNARYVHDLLQGRLRGESGRWSFIFVDVDDYKAVNDRFGHQVGDKVLKELAQMLQGLARRSDVVCRYGGDEFLIATPLTDREEAVNLGERIRAAVEQTNFCFGCEQPVSVTVSVGVAADGSMPLESLFWLADRALYNSKHLGRNTVSSN